VAISNNESALIVTGIMNEVKKPRTKPSQIPDSIIGKTTDTAQPKMAHNNLLMSKDTERIGIVRSTSVIPKQELGRQAMAPTEDTAALIQEGVQQKQTSSVGSASEAVHPHRIFLTPPAPAMPEKSTHQSEKREQRDSDSSPAIHIGTLEVRINPPKPPRKVVSSTTSSPRGVAPLAQGFRSFGLAQG
jgi:hypothetical protein